MTQKPKEPIGEKLAVGGLIGVGGVLMFAVVIGIMLILAVPLGLFAGFAGYRFFGVVQPWWVWTIAVFVLQSIFRAAASANANANGKGKE